MPKCWLVVPPLSQEIKDKFPQLPAIVLHLLFKRGLDNQLAIDEFLNPDYIQDLHDPYKFKEMHRAVDRIYQAIANRQSIAVFADYDADGVCAATLLIQTLGQLGATKLQVYIPHRDKEGYGMNQEAVKYLADLGVNLVITVDCGITNFKEIESANDLGMDVIVTDHHLESQQLPPALAIIDAHVTGETYPFKELCGVGVAFKLAQALLKDARCPLGSVQSESWEKWLLDLVAIGTVADVVPLLGENRTLLKYGLMVLKKSRRLGLQQLAAAGGIDLSHADPHTIGWQIAPRLNAAGRMDHANTAYVLLSTNALSTAKELADNLQAANSTRQTQVEQMVQQALQQVGQPSDEQKILFVYADGWSGSLVGLVAGRLTQQWHRPAFALGFDQEKYIGSGRSIPGFDITLAIAQHTDLLGRFGGHAGACGCTVTKENLPKFIKAMTEQAAAKINNDDLIPTIEIDMEIKITDLNWEVLDQLSLFEPYGQENPKPLMVSRNLKILEIQPVGKDSNHLRIHVQEDGKDVFKTIAFSAAQSWGNQLRVGQKVDLVYEPSINEWNGSRELQLKIIDWQPSG